MTKAELNAFKRELADSDARHSVAIFLILYAVIGLDIMSVQDERLRQKITAAWVAWGVTFVLLGFFIITPEQDAIAIQRAMKRSSLKPSQKRPAAG